MNRGTYYVLDIAAAAFENAVDETTNYLNTTPWDDLLIQAGGSVAMHGYISGLFRGYLEANLSILFGGAPNTSLSPCNGVTGFIPAFQIGC